MSKQKWEKNQLISCTLDAEQYIHFGLCSKFIVQPCGGEVLKGSASLLDWLGVKGWGIRMEYCTTPESLNNDKLIFDWGVMYVHTVNCGGT